MKNPPAWLRKSRRETVGLFEKLRPARYAFFVRALTLVAKRLLRREEVFL